MSAGEIVERAWRELPASDRRLLEAIRADQWRLCGEPLGTHVDELLRSAGGGFLTGGQIARTNAALAVWVRELRVVLINDAHPSFDGLDEASLDYDLSKIAWHEWGHALAIDRATHQDVASGEHYVDLLPDGLRRIVRGAGYRPREYTHEVVAEIYSMLMMLRRHGVTGKPSWLHPEIYELVRRVAGWNQ